MSDSQQKYINTYIEHAIGMLHEYVNMVVQLKTQLKIVNDLIKEKDEVISSLQEQNESNKHSSEEVEKANANARSWEEQFNAMKGKVSILDTLTNQFNDAKKMVLEKNQEIQRLTSEIDGLRPQISERNTQIENLTRELNNVRKEVERLTKENEKLTPKTIEKKATVTAPKKVINTKNTTVVKPVVIEPDKNDDF